MTEEKKPKTTTEEPSALAAEVEALKKNFKDVKDQAVNRTYLGQGFVSHKGVCSGIPVEVRTLRRGERTFIDRVAPVGFYSDQHTANKIVRFASGSTPQTMNFNEIMEEFRLQVGVKDLFESLMLVFAVVDFDTESLPFSLGDIKTLAELQADSVFQEKLKTINNWPAEVVDLLLVMISETNLMFRVAMDDIIKNPS